jgi:adenylate cyclase
LLHLQLLGGFGFYSSDGKDITPTSRKVCGLLACLALPTGTLWSRDRLATIFWGEREEAQARASLRQALTDLRRSLGSGPQIQVERNGVRLDPAAVTVDAMEFEQAINTGDFERAERVYRGDLLDGFTLSGDGFHDWLIVERTRLRDLAVDAILRLAATQAGVVAIRTCQRVLQIDSTREDAHRLLMKLYAGQNQRAPALRQYQICRDTLQREIGTRPDRETEALFQQLQHGGIQAPELAVIQPPALCPSEKHSIAVLPFNNMSNDPEEEFFSDGLTEDLITDLANISGLFVPNRNIAFTYKSKVVNLERIAKELSVAYLIEGSVRRAGQKVRINVQLIEGATGAHIWAARYDRNLSDIFAVQDEITKTIVEQLKVKLLPEEKRVIEEVPTDNVEAYTYYLKGRELFHMGTRSSLKLARHMFARATELDPQFARALGGIAASDSRLFARHDLPISIDETIAIADRALAIDCNLAEVHAARAISLMVGNRRIEAASAFEQALGIDPNCHEAHYYYAHFCVTGGDFERAATHYLRATEIQPGDYASPLLLQQVFHSLGRPEEAANYSRIGLKRAEEALQLHPENSKPACMGASALAYLGERKRAKEWLALALAIDHDDNSVRYSAACTYSLLGEIDRAIDLLETWLPLAVPTSKLWFKNDSDLEPIRTHPRYKKLLELAS